MFDPETQVFRNYTVKDGLPGNYILAINEGFDGNLWIGSNEGLSKFDGTTFLNYSRFPIMYLASNLTTMVFCGSGDTTE